MAVRSEQFIDRGRRFADKHSGTAGTIRNETVTFLENVTVSLRKSSLVSVSLRFLIRTIPKVTNSLRSTFLT